MSLVADVIASAKNRLGMTDIFHVDVGKLFSQAELARDNVCNALNEHYVLLSSALNDNSSLLDGLKKCQENIESLSTEIDKEVIPSVEGSANEIEKVTLRLAEVKLQIEATQLLFDIHMLLEESQLALNSDRYIETLENLNKVDEFLSVACTKKVESQLEILSTLREQLVMNRTDLIMRIDEKWNKVLFFSEEEFDEGIRVRLSIQGGLSSSNSQGDVNHWREMIIAIIELGEIKRIVRTLGKNLLRHFIKPIIVDGGELKAFHRPETGVYSICVQKTTARSTRIQGTTSAVIILNYLEMVFEFLNGHFGSFSLGENCDGYWFMSHLGSEIGDEFINLVLNSCLEESVPSDRKDLTTFTEVQVRVEEFHKFLVHIGFYSNTHKSLLNYVSDVESVYGKKTREGVLATARHLMTHSLDKTVDIPSPLLPDEPLSVTNEYVEENINLNPKYRELSGKTFNLPNCQISSSIYELLDLLYKTLEEASESSPEFAARLFITVRNVLSMYCYVVPVAHAHTLISTPEHGALIHNNSLFLAHHVLLLGNQFKKLQSSSLPQSASTAVDLGFLIRSCGCEVFLKTLQGHKRSLIEKLRTGLDCTSLKYDGPSVDPLRRSVQECVDQLLQLREAWHKILSESIYEKSIGTLAGSVVEDLVHCITTLEEISADDAIGLIDILNLLKTNLPSLFDDPQTVVIKVSPWEKMNELIIVLDASLRGLCERWADGKGPFALHFSPAELRHLIKAIFQNTERRAQFLSKIK